MKRGFQRVKIDGTYYEIGEAPALDKKFKHDIDVVVDRLVVRPDIGLALADSFETALELADGIAVVEFADEKDDKGAPRRMTSSPRNSPARSPASRSPRSSRACSRSTIPSAPALPAAGSGRSRRSIPT
jgi:excinuclease UvrABC ATPase subunit